MKKLIASLFVLGSLSSALPASAHDAKYHREKPVHGTIEAVKDASVTLSTEKGEQQVTLTGSTKVQKGETSASKSDLHPGQHLMVFGTKLESGELVAREILIQPDSPVGGRNPSGDQKKSERKENAPS